MPDQASAEPQTMRYAIRPMHIGDARQVSGIEKDAFPEVWPPTQFGKELRNHLARHLVAWDTEGTEEDVAAGEAGSQLPWQRTIPLIGRFLPTSNPTPSGTEYLVGYVALWFMVDEAHITSIAVKSSHRGKGIGELLLIASVEMGALQRSRMVTLETRVSNIVAQNLYKKYGFSIVGRRKRYYSDNNEDAYVMSTGDTTGEEYRTMFNDLRRQHSLRWGVSTRNFE